jgi:magnesium transporter
VETLREMLSGMIDLHSTQVNQRMNEIMKFLTMMSATFVPLNLIAAIYGMNFKNMPELGISWMYFAVWGLMLAIVGGMLYLYKKKDWL